MTFADGYGRELSTQKLARFSELLELQSGKARVDCGELTIEDQEQNEVCAFYQIPVRMIFGEQFTNGYKIRYLASLIGIVKRAQ